jgi:hypothetical protein
VGAAVRRISTIFATPTDGKARTDPATVIGQAKVESIGPPRWASHEAGDNDRPPGGQSGLAVMHSALAEHGADLWRDHRQLYGAQPAERAGPLIQVRAAHLGVAIQLCHQCPKLTYIIVQPVGTIGGGTLRGMSPRILKGFRPPRRQNLDVQRVWTARA